MKNYQKDAGVTDEKDYSEIQNRMGDEFNAKALHYALGLCTEAGEIQDALKKHVIYGRELDRVNLIEEVGDLLWYQARLLSLLDSSFEEAMEVNIKKLKSRFGDKFTEDKALDRNTEKERELMESLLISKGEK